MAITIRVKWVLAMILAQVPMTTYIVLRNINVVDVSRPQAVNGRRWCAEGFRRHVSRGDYAMLCGPVSASLKDVPLNSSLPNKHQTAKPIHYNVSSANDTSHTSSMEKLWVACGNGKITVPFPSHLGTDYVWNDVDEKRSTIVVSAYFTDQAVYVVGVNRLHAKCTCQLWYEGQGRNGSQTIVRMEEVSAFPKALEGSNKKRYSAVLFRCNVSSKNPPTYVSIVTQTCNIATNLMRVKDVRKQQTYERRFTVCLNPLNFNFSRAYQLVEWIELNRLHGAETFIIYNHTSAPNVAAVLDYYSQQNLVEVVQWNIPLVVDTWPHTTRPEIHYFGQLAVLQDCLYRSKRNSEFVVNIDIDEFIVPRMDGVNTWSELLTHLNNSFAQAYIFRNMFYRLEWTDTDIPFPNKDIALKYKLVTLLKNRHERKAYAVGARSKLIIRTEGTEFVQVHFKYDGFPVPAEMALLHHYRSWEKYNDPESTKIPDTIVVDKYGNNLTARVAMAWKQLQGVALDLLTVPLL